MTEQEVVTLEKYFDRILLEQTKAHQHEHQMLANDLSQTRVELDLRLGRENEVRKEILEERAGSVKRDVFDARMGALEERIRISERSLVSVDTRLTTWLAAAVILLGIIEVALRLLVR